MGLQKKLNTLFILLLCQRSLQAIITFKIHLLAHLTDTQQWHFAGGAFSWVNIASEIFSIEVFYSRFLVEFERSPSPLETEILRLQSKILG